MTRTVYASWGIATILLTAGHVAVASDKIELQRTDIPKTDLRLDLPKGWEKGGISGKGVLASFRAGKGLYPNVNVMLEEHGAKTAEEVMKESLSRLPSVEVHYQKKETINGLEAVVSDTSWRSILGGLRAVRLVTGYHGKTLIITFVDKSANMTESKHTAYFKCLRSLAPSKPS